MGWVVAMRMGDGYWDGWVSGQEEATEMHDGCQDGYWLSEGLVDI